MATKPLPFDGQIVMPCGGTAELMADELSGPTSKGVDCKMNGMPARPRLLFIEDNRHALVAGARLLSSYGFDVEIARTAQVAVTKATRRHFDVIVTDVLLPDRTARDICQHLQRTPATRDIPVIAYTAVTDPHVLAELFRLGVRVFAIKPCVPRVLADEARRLLNQQERRSTARVVTGFGHTLDTFAALIDAHASAASTAGLNDLPERQRSA
jgi:CheY-like chemotaxis protein